MDYTQISKTYYGTQWEKSLFFLQEEEINGKLKEKPPQKQYRKVSPVIKSTGTLLSNLWYIREKIPLNSDENNCTGIVTLELNKGYTE